jgi:hypothetical protein
MGMTKSLQRSEPKLNIKANYNFYLAKGDNYMRHFIGDIQVRKSPALMISTIFRNSESWKAPKRPMITSAPTTPSKRALNSRILLLTSLKLPAISTSLMIKFLTTKKSG